MKFCLKKTSKIASFAAGLVISGAALAMVIPLRFPLINVLNSQTLAFRGYEQFKAKVNGKACKASSKKAHYELAIHFNELLQPHTLQIDGRSGASTVAKQQDELMRRFRIAGQFQITQINGIDQEEQPLTGSYSGHAQRIILRFDQPQALAALIAERDVCKGLTQFNVAEDNRGDGIYSAVLNFNGGKQTATLSLDSQIVDVDDSRNIGQYKALFQTVPSAL